MSVKTIARLVNPTSTAVALNSNIPFTVNDITNNEIAYNETKILLKSPGIYKVTANFTVTSAVAGTAAINLQENGTNFPGATASESLGENDIANLAFSTIVQVKPQCCSNSYATLTFNNVNAMTYLAANVIIEKICG